MAMALLCLQSSQAVDLVSWHSLLHVDPADIEKAGRAHPNVSSGVIPSSPRGPPRKPKQSGHALWVGNLPSGARVSDLKDHFSRDATRDIESVFLISKSNCAFVNYRTDAACAAAMTRFHDSRFQGVRLVCRLRRTSAATSTTGAPLGPAALMPSIVQSQTAFEAITQNREVSSRAEEMAKAERTQDGDVPVKHSDKYFIMKSLTVEDMELSVRNSTWATQSHNEEALNKAFEVSFSMGKFGVFRVLRHVRPPRTSISSFLPTSLGSILALLGWLLQSTKKQPKTSNGLREQRLLWTTRTYLDRSQPPPQNLHLVVA